MSGTDMIIGWTNADDSNSGFVGDFWSQGHGRPDEDGHDDLFDTAVKFEDGRTQVTFTDHLTLQMNNALHLIYRLVLKLIWTEMPPPAPVQGTYTPDIFATEENEETCVATDILQCATAILDGHEATCTRAGACVYTPQNNEDFVLRRNQTDLCFAGFRLPASASARVFFHTVANKASIPASLDFLNAIVFILTQFQEECSLSQNQNQNQNQSQVVLNSASGPCR